MKPLREETVEKVQELIRINLDSEEGFRTAAECVEDSALKRIFTEMTEERGGFARDLRSYVAWSGEEATDSGSFKGKVHRWWLELRSRIQPNDTVAVLAEAERGEDRIKAVYEDILVDTAGCAINDVLLQQYAAIKRGHDAIRELRDAEKIAS